MTNFVWKAKDQAGREVICEEPAESAKASRAQLLARGFSDLKLLENEIQEAVSEGFRDHRERLGKKTVVTAKDRAKVRDQPPATFKRAIIKALTQRADVNLALAIWAAILAYNGHGAVALLVVLALILWILWLVWLRLPLVFFGKLLTAESWHRWDQAMRYIRILEFMGKNGSGGIYPAALARHYSKALAGKGDLAGGLAYYKPYRGQPGCPDWLHDSMSAAICDAAKQHDLAIEYSLKSIAIKPEACAYRGLAMRYLRRERDVESARKALATVADEPIPETVMPTVHLCHGILATLEGDYPLAERELKSCLEVVALRKRMPYRVGVANTAKAYLACVQARQGRLDEARKLYTEARVYLVAVGETELMAECEEAIKPSS